MNTQQAWDLVGGLSKPSKMPGWSYGLPAKECKTGSKLRKVKGSTCHGCYALKGCYDVQDEDHLTKIFAVCRSSPSVKHWLPTREAWVKHFLPLAPDNLVIRFSMPMIDQAAAGGWANTSTVVTSGATCPAPKQNNECKDCRNCWNPEIKNVSYGKH